MRVKTASVRVAVATLLALLVAPACGRGTTGASDAAADADIDAPTDATEAGDLGTDLGDGLDADAPRIEHNGVAVQEQDGDLTLTGDLLVVRYHLAEGRLDILGTEGRVVVQGAFARAVLAGPGAATATFDTTSQDLVSWQAEPCSEPLGEGVAVTLVRQSKAAGNPGLVVRLWVLHRAAYLLADLSVDLPDGDPRRVQSLSPMVVEGSRAGGLFIGHDPLQHLVVDNGTDKYFDFTARVFAVGNGDSLLFGPGSASNWNAAIHDPESGRAVVAGFLTFNKGLGLVLLDFSAKDALVDDGRQGFTRFEGRIGYDPPRPPDPGGDGTSHLASERFYLDVNPQTAQEGLEQYAARVAANAGKKLWTDVPSGWNSWGGGSGSHGLGQDIDEPTILANLEAMAQDFPQYGMKYFQIDDGWQDDSDYWTTNPARFPPHDGLDGMAWIAKEIKARGLIPGIWIAPFRLKKASQLAQEHPDWLAPVSDLGGILVGDDEAILDLTHPEVPAHLDKVFTRVTQEWGYRWIKLDFSYYALFAASLHDPNKTASEAYLDALRRIRKAIGPDTFFLTISAVGLCFDVADGNRITLDNEPWWGDDEDQGIKVTLHTLAHRWYLSRLWVNHPDLLFFRPDYGLTMNEARAWASFVALTGGIVKLGEPFTEMHAHPEWEAVVQPLLPVYPHAARPLDLFDLKFPEVWWERIEREDHSWHVLGLFNWGLNEEVASTRQVPEAPRTKTVSLAALGQDASVPWLVFDAWDHTCRWVDDGIVEETLAPRTERILVLRGATPLPEIVATSRHLLGGAMEVTEEETAVAGDTVTLTALVDAPVGVPVTIFVSEGDYKLEQVLYPADATVGPPPCDGVLPIKLVPGESPASIGLRCTAP